MSPARLLLPILLSCSLFAAGQSHEAAGFLLSSDASQPNPAPLQSSFERAATPSEPWRIIPQKSELPSGALDRIRTPEVSHRTSDGAALRIVPQSGNDNIAISLEGSGTDATCYAIRSYVVARDSKESEATHPVSYSTCQPASRYRLRKTVVNGSPER